MTFDYRHHAVPGAWADRAACKGRTDEMVIPATPKGGAYTLVQFDLIAAAVNICQGCPVLAQCRGWALTGDDFADDPARQMVAGGYTPKQRQAIRRGEPVPPLRRAGRPRKGAA